MRSWLIGKDTDAVRVWGQEEKGTAEDEMAGWHHRLYAHVFEWTLGVGDGRGGLRFMGSQSRTRLSDWTELNCLGFFILEMWRMISMVINNYITEFIQRIKWGTQSTESKQWPILSTKQCQATIIGNSLAVQWLGLSTFTARPGFNPWSEN